MTFDKHKKFTESLNVVAENMKTSREPNYKENNFLKPKPTTQISQKSSKFKDPTNLKREKYVKTRIKHLTIVKQAIIPSTEQCFSRSILFLLQ